MTSGHELSTLVVSPLPATAPPTSRRDGLWKVATGPTARQSFWAVLDQSLMSGANFLTSLMLARFCEPTEYGAYTLAFFLLLFLNALQATLLTNPMMVLGPARDEEGFRRYISSLAWAQAIGGAVLAALTVLVAAVALFSGRSEALSSSFLAMGAAVFFVQAQEFCRRVLFARMQTRRLARNDAVYCGLQVVFLLLLWKLGGGVWNGSAAGYLSGRNVFLSLGLAAVAALAVGLIQIRPYLVTGRNACVTETGRNACVTENWQYARWGLGSLLGEFLHVQVNLSIVAAVAGAAATATMEAPRLILAPLNILSFTCFNVLTPRAAEKYGRNGTPALVDFVKRVAPLAILPFIAYPLLIAAAPGFWLSMLYQDRYSGAGSVLLLWAASFSVAGLRVLPWIVVSVLRRPDIAMWASLSVGLLIVALSLGLTPAFGPGGAVAARLIGDVVYLAAGWIVAWRLLRRRSE